MAGFSDKIFQVQLKEKFNCPICLLVLRNPVQTVCGHLFCELCILQVFRNFDTVCPIDNTSLNGEQKLYPDMAVKKEMSQFLVECPNRGYGCEWKGTLGDFENNHETRCPFFPGERPRNANEPREHDENE